MHVKKRETEINPLPLRGCCASHSKIAGPLRTHTAASTQFQRRAWTATTIAVDSANQVNRDAEAQRLPGAVCSVDRGIQLQAKSQTRSVSQRQAQRASMWNEA